MDRVLKELDALVHRGAALAQVEVYHWELRREGSQKRLAVQVDRPGGVTLEDCVRASRAIDALLEESDPVSGSYVLEVSSPGVERRLWEPRHYAQAVGKLVHVRIKSGGSHRGRLLRVEADAIVLGLAEGELVVPFPEVAGAHLVFEQDSR